LEDPDWIYGAILPGRQDQCHGADHSSSLKAEVKLSSVEKYFHSIRVHGVLLASSAENIHSLAAFEAAQFIRL
jgi:hypothetical protein